MPIVTADISGVWIVHFAETIENSTVTAHKNGRLRVAENILEVVVTFQVYIYDYNKYL